ncbi:MAG: site-specific integrase [Arcanobacterium sp.]|nr:site-specific integrase [Arcanobacterium sp.]MDY6142907.1 tyrosine-type recombinase/integrase [Arcanobacterium sp.]
MARKKIKPKMSHRLEYGQGSFTYLPAKDTWRGRIDVGVDTHGKRIRLEVSAKNEDEAWLKLMGLKRQVGNMSKSELVKLHTTVGDWVEEWLSRREHYARPKTYASEKGALHKWIVPRLGSRQLRSITGDDVREIAVWQQRAGNSTTTARHIQRLLQQLLRDARADGYLVDDTALLAKIARPAVNHRQALTVEQATAVLDVAAREPMGSRWVAALLQGMRQGECLGLTWECVDFERRLIDVSWQLQELAYEDKAADRIRVPDGYEARRLYGTYHLTRPKTHAGQRIIPMVPWMEAALAAWRERAPYSVWGLVWCRDDGTPMNSKHDLHRWKMLQREAGVARPDGKPFVLHEARNTCATLLLEAGVDIEVIKTILGHSSIAMSRAYMRVNEELTRDALEKVAQRLRLGK